MERNTYATSAYIETSAQEAFEYLAELENLGEWTLFSRMKEQVDEDTWRGTASGYQDMLYYHVKRIETPQFMGVEWHCGLRYNEYHQVYPVLLFPSEYVGEGAGRGVYFHWVSFVDPKRGTPMIKEGIETVHNSECRSLKAALERRGGCTEAAPAPYRIETDTIYVDAPFEAGVSFISDVERVADWAHLLRRSPGLPPGALVDEYDQRVELRFTTHRTSRFALIEQDYRYADHGFVQRCPTLVVPASYAFSDPDAPGFLQHRITFWKQSERPRRGRLSIDDFGAESINIKRMLESEAGNLETFAKGCSYRPDPS